MVDRVDINIHDESNEHPSSDRRMSRADFLRKAMIAGSLASAPLVLDKFLIQPAAAQTRGTMLQKDITR